LRRVNCGSRLEELDMSQKAKQPASSKNQDSTALQGSRAKGASAKPQMQNEPKPPFPK